MKLLVLGGTRFIGRAFCEKLLDAEVEFTILNRGVTNPGIFEAVPRIVCDRDNRKQCQEQLANSHWDSVVDFSAFEHRHIENILLATSFSHYCFFSSSAVDLSWPGDELFGMAQHKAWCEYQLASCVENLLVIRPGFVVGKHDYTQRFERHGAIWVWKGTTDPVNPVIETDMLASTAFQLIGRRHKGIVKAGYTKSRLQRLIGKE